MNPSPSVPKFVFEQPASPGGEAFEMFRAGSLPHFKVDLRDPADAPRFYVSATTYQMPHLIMTRVRGGAMTMQRGEAEIANDPNAPVLTIHVQIAGDSDGIADGRAYRLAAGDVLFFDYARPLQCTNSDYECVVLLMSRERAHPAFLRPQAHGAILSRESGVARLIAAAATQAHALLGDMTIPQADLALQSLIDLAGRLLDENLAAARARSETASPIGAALTYIDTNLDDETLSAAAIADRLGLSRSALYRVFEPLGGVDNTIRQRRLDRAMRTILTSNNAEAREARNGFNNEEQFARAFQNRFGARPARYREVMQSNDKAWLIEQARSMGYSSLEEWIQSLNRN